MRAAGSDADDTVNFLLRVGASINGRDMHGNTALMLACIKGNVSIAKALLVAGADSTLANYVSYPNIQQTYKMRYNIVLVLNLSHQDGYVADDFLKESKKRQEFQV